MRTYNWREVVRGLDPDPDAPQAAYRFACRTFFQPRRPAATRPGRPPVVQPPPDDGGKCYLLAEDGSYVLNGSGGRIEIGCDIDGSGNGGGGGGPIVPPSSGPYDHLPPGAIGREIEDVQINLPPGSGLPVALDQYKVGDLLAVEDSPSTHYVLERDASGNKVWTLQKADDEGSGSALPIAGTVEFNRFQSFLLHSQTVDSYNGWWRKSEAGNHWVQVEKPGPTAVESASQTNGSGQALPVSGDPFFDQYETFLLYGQVDQDDNGSYRKLNGHWVKVTD